MQTPDERVRTGRIEPHAVEALAGLLGRPVPERLPPTWHLCQLLDAPPQSDLGPDGHPLRGLPVPPGPGMRRMFAGGRATHLRPLEIGAAAERRTSVVSTEEKQGRSGPLTFVTIRHEFRQGGELAVVDEHDIVYRPDARAGVLLESTAGSATCAGRPFDVDPVVLFRFSALTYNAHRIHYDRDHAASEGYADLVVHGPLQVVLMAGELELAGRSLAYRLVSPVIGPQRLVVRRPAPGEPGDADVEVRAGNGSVVSHAAVRNP